MKKLFLFFITITGLFFIPTQAHAWQKTFGGGDDEVGLSIQQTNDSGYIIAGWTESFGAGGQDVYLIKTNASGDTLWTKTFGGLNDDVARSVKQTGDGGYIVVGTTNSFGAGYDDIYLIKTDIGGNLIWQQTYGGDNQDGATALELVEDGYVIVGYTASFGVDFLDLYLIKVDTLGNLIWQKMYGGTDWDGACSVQKTTDQGYIITGYTYSFGQGGCDVWLLKTNSGGDTLWTKTFGDIDGDIGRSVKQTNDGGYIIAGVTNQGSYDIYLIKIDISGNLVWQKFYDRSYLDWGTSIEQTDDGGYIIVADTKTGPYYDVWLLKIDSRGDTLWTKIIGGNSEDQSGAVRQTNDGGYIIVGYTNSFGYGGYDVYLIKTDSLGNELNISEEQKTINKEIIKIFPNPFVDYITVQGLKEKIILVYDAAGRKVGEYSGKMIGADLKSGIYFLKIEGNNTSIRIVKIR